MFDNSAWTWGTDYALAVFMFSGAYSTSTLAPSTLRDRTVGLLSCMGVSVLVGALCHQFYTGGIDPSQPLSLNSLSFRLLWSVCVGTVTLAGGFIGSTGSHLSRLSRSAFKKNKRFHVYVVPDWWWCAWGLLLTALVFAGGLSMQRPAADIFIAGISQTAPSCYIFVVTLSNSWERSVKHFERMLWFAFFLNAPLLPLYPVFVKMQQENDAPLGLVNAALHFWLAVAWGMQFIALNGFCRRLYGGEAGVGKKKRR
jgi:hypothetical protein